MNDFQFHHLPSPQHSILRVPLLSIFDPDFKDVEQDESVGLILASFSPLPIYVVRYKNPDCFQYDYRIIGGSEFYQAVCAARRSPTKIGVHLCEKEIPPGCIIPTISEFFQSHRINPKTHIIREPVKDRELVVPEPKKERPSSIPGVLAGKIDMAKVRRAAQKIASREADPVTHWTDLIADSERPERTVTNPKASWN